MTPWELGVAAILYLSVARRYGLADDPGMAAAFVFYACANFGFMYSAANLR